MRLNLREIINIPGGEIPFDFEMDMSDFKFDSVKEFKTPVRVTGKVENRAGVLTLTAHLSADLICICARCLKEFPKHLGLRTYAFLAEELQDEDNIDYYLLDGDYADIGEIAGTALVLNMDQRYLCKDDCKGLCPKCGKDLNEGPCSCGEDHDPRLAVLGQLLERED
ncbi:MAG: YceD family protein [Oscillospiraceae bacterium]